MIYDKLKTIENELNGNEYFEHGVTYCIGFDSLDVNLPIGMAIKNQLVKYEVLEESEELYIEKIEDYLRDIDTLFQEWHLDMITNSVLKVLSDNAIVYKVLDDCTIYYSKGSLCSVFRVIEMLNERILVELYIID